MKSIVLKSPEYLLIVLVFLAGYTPPFHMNPFCIGVIVILMLQLIFKNRIFGLLLGTLYFLVTLYFLGALLSEFNEFTEVNNSAKQLLLVGIPLWVLNVVLSSIMIYRYATDTSKETPELALKEQNIGS